MAAHLEMNRIEKKPILLINSTDHLKSAIKEIKQYQSIAIDLEADSFYRYHERICLFQIGTLENIYLIDMLADLAIAPLQEIIENKTIEKIFHDAAYDIAILKKTSINPKNIFDTAIAARYIGIRKLGLKSLLKEFFNVQITKKFKRADWGKRPLSQKMIEYAANDVRYLIELKSKLIETLEKTDVLEILQEKCSQLENIKPKVKIFNPDSYIKLPGVQSLPPERKTIVKALYIWRETEAQRINRPPFMILSKEKIIEIGKRSIDSLENVRQVLGTHTKTSKKYSEIIFSIISEASRKDSMEISNGEYNGE